MESRRSDSFARVDAREASGSGRAAEGKKALDEFSYASSLAAWYVFSQPMVLFLALVSSSICSPVLSAAQGCGGLAARFRPGLACI